MPGRDAGYNTRVNTMPLPLTRWVARVLPQPLTDLPVAALAAEASFRHFYRIGTGAQSWIVMDSPPQRENNQQFTHLAEVFGDAGLPVPEVLAADDVQGFYLLTDLGQRDFEAAYQQGESDRAIAAAIDALVVLQQVEDSQIVPYTEQRFTDELGIFSEWFLAGLLETSLPESLRQSFTLLINRCCEQSQVCVHRDYHCRNLLYSEDGALGIVDFQDALRGPAAYDLASLLRDCYFELPEDQIEHWCGYFLEQKADQGCSYPAAQFRVDLDFCAIQRQLKAIGIFARLKQRDNKPSHLRYISPLLQRLVSLCRCYPELVALGNYLEQLQPLSDRWQI